MPLGHRNVVSGQDCLATRSDRGHSRRRLIGLIVCSAVLLAASCGPGVEKIVTLTFSKDRPDAVTISTSTELGEAAKGSPEQAIIDRERQALLTNTDEWAIRFDNAEPESERITVDRQKQLLRRVERSAVVPVANLQRFFFDTPLTVSVTNGEGWMELTILAGTSNRATRQEIDQVEDLLTRFSSRAVRYFNATRAMYVYLNSNDARSEALFYGLAASLAKDDEKKAEIPPQMQLSDNEEKLVAAAADSISAMLDDGRGGDSGAVDRAFDVAFNPFAAEMHVVVPGEPLEVEGFEKVKGGGLTVKSTGVMEAVAALEGKWVSPDPLAGLLHAEETENGAARFAASMAEQPRHAADVVRAEDVRHALVAKMKPPSRFRVRWITTVPRRPSS